MKKRFFAVSLTLFFAIVSLVFPFSAANVEAKGVKAEVEKSGWKDTFTGIEALGETYTLSPR